MNVFDSCPKIYFGDSSLDYLASLKNEKILIITDPFMVSSGMLKRVTDIFDKRGLDYDVFSEIVPDPPISVISAGIQITLAKKPETVIAFGGGSAIDAAKAIIYFCVKLKSQLMERKYVHEPFFIAIPTTSGTGSEVTGYSVVTDEKNNTKIVIRDNSMLPDVALLCPIFTKTLPKNIVAHTGMDVLTHSVEAFVSNSSTEFSDMYAREAFKKAVESLPLMYNKLEDENLREQMYIASTMAGIAFNNAGLGITHSIAHAFGGEFHLPHGMLNSVIMPFVIAFNGGISRFGREGVPDRYSLLAQSIGINTGDQRNDTKALVMLLQQLNSTFGIPNSLKLNNISESDFNSKLLVLVDKAMADICTLANPVALSKITMENLIRAIYNGENITA